LTLQIITDSTADLPLYLKNTPHLTVMPLTVHFGDESYIDGVNLTNEEFYEKLCHSYSVPTTSQISATAFKAVFNEMSGKGDDVLGIFISSDLSGTFASASLARSELGKDNIYVIDSRTVTLGLTVLVQQAINLRAQGYSAKEIYEKLEEQKDKIRLYAKVDTLKYLKKGGRLSTAGAVLGTLLNVKPVVTVSDGKVLMARKARGNSKSLQWIKEKALADGIDVNLPVALGYSNNSSLLKELEDTLCEGLNIQKYVPVSIGATVGTHGGPNIMALAYFMK